MQLMQLMHNIKINVNSIASIASIASMLIAMIDATESVVNKGDAAELHQSHQYFL